MGTDLAADITKLKLSSLKLYGRGKELERLHDSLQRICEPVVCGDVTSEIVFVHGASGTGKTALVETLRGPVINEHRGYFVSGKFEQVHGTTRPYSAIVCAFTQLCDAILQSSDGNDTIATIKKALGNEAGVLTNVLPRLGSILGVEESEVGSAGRSTQEANLRMFDRLLRLFRSFLRAVCASSRPLVIFLDDLQWIDAASLELMTYLANNTAAMNFLLIGAYRDNEVDMHHPLSVKLKELNESSDVITISISLGDIGMDDVNRLVADATGLHLSDTEDLSELVYRKTRGNCLFVIQFLVLLHERQFLRFSAESCRWQWDLSRIEGETNVSDNVVEIVLERIQRLPRLAQDVLKIAACLGFFFDPHVVSLTMRSQEIENENHVGTSVSIDGCPISNGSIDERIEIQVHQSIDLLMKMVLVENGPSPWMKFSHDRIQQCAYLLISEGDERERLHLRIGHLLRSVCESTPAVSDWIYFTTVDQLNRGSRHIVSQSEKIELARLNLEAGKKAKSKSAFIPAAEYIRAALELLQGPLRWNENYDLSLELCSHGAEMERCSGNGERCKAMVDEVLSNAHSLQDRFYTRLTYIKLLGGQGRLEDAVDEGVKVLAELGEKFPRNPNSWHTITTMMKTKRMLRGMSQEQLISLPMMEDHSRLAALKLLAALGIYAFFSRKKKYLPLFYCRIVQSSVLGMSEFTAYGFASYGFTLTLAGDINEGYRFGMLALKLIEKFSLVEQTPKVVVLVHSFIHHWKQPFQASLEPLLSGYKLGMELGNIENGLMCAAAYCTMYFWCGLPLGPLVDDIKNYVQQMVDYQQKGVYYGTLPLWQFALNLIGPSENPLVLTGEAMDQEKVSNEVAKSGNTVAVHQILSVQQQLAYIFGDLKRAKRLLKEMRTLKDGMTALAGYCREVFFLGLTSLWVARSTRKRKYRLLAQYYMRVIQKWVNNKAVNCHHMLLLMKAERASLRVRGTNTDDVRAVRRAYDKAISSAARSGFIQDAALGSERAAIFHREVWDENWAESYLHRALAWYKQWGAGALVSHLENRYGCLLDNMWAYNGSSFRGRIRFDHQVALNHRTIALGDNPQSPNQI